ncbi:MAG: PAS domain S-box protein [Chloroflexi bacterium]|nr:PAS domain S-box protein [Chloroflexota bacterium]
MNKHPTILLTDDNPDDRVLVKRLLRAEFPDFRALEARTQAELERTLEAGGFDAVVTDYHLHWTDGLQVLAAVKARHPDVPVIMLTGTGTEEVAVEGMKQGLTDYLLKKHMARLPAALCLALERAEAQQRAVEMETRLHTLLDQLNVGVFRLSRRGKLLDANRAALRLLGLRSVQEARQMDPAEIFAHPRERLSLVKRAIKERGLRSCPVQLRRTDGRLVWASLTVTVSRQARGEMVVEGLLEDITAQKRAQVEIEAAHEYLRTLHESCPDAIIATNTDGQISVFNPGAEEMLGYRAEEILQQPVERLYPSREDAKAVMRAMRADPRGLARNLEKMLRHKDGRLIPVLLSAAILRDAGGQEQGTAGYIKNLTERRRAEAQQRLQSAALEAAANGIVITARDGTIRWVNPAFTRLTGYTAEEALGQDPRIFRPDKYNQAFYQDLWDTILAGKVWHGDVINRRKDGSLYHEEMTITPVRDDEGAVSHFIAIVEDVTERVRSQERLHRRDAILAAVAFAAAQFLRTTSWEQGIQEVLERLGRAAQVSRAYIAENQTNEAGDLLAFMRFEWVAPGVEPQITKAVLQGFSWDAGGFGRWADTLAGGEPISGPVHGFPPGERAIFDHLDIRSIAVAPVFVGSEWWGVIGLDECLTEREWSSAELDALKAAADTLGAAIQNAQLLEAERTRRCEIEAVQQATLGLTASLDLPDVLNAILRATLDLLPALDTHIFLYTEGRLTFGSAMWADGRTGQPFAEPRPDGLTYTVARQGEPIVVPDIRTHPLFTDTPAEWKGAIVGLPLKIGNKVVGVMNVAYSEPRPFPESELRMLRLLADQAAIAIENARLLETERASREQAVALREATRTISSSLELRQILRHVLEQLKRVLVYDHASVFVFEEDVPELVVGTGFENEQFTSAEARKLLRESPILCRMAGDLQPVVADDVRTLEEWIWVPGAGDIRSWMGIPLVVQGRMIGTLMIDSSKVGFFGEQDVRVAQTLVQHVAQAIENARLFAEARQRADQMTALNRISAAISTSLDLEGILQTALDTILDLTGLDAGGVGLWNPKEKQLRVGAARHFPADVLEMYTTSLRPGGMRELVLTEGQAVFIEDVLADSRVNILTQIEKVRCVTLIPMRLRERVLGLLVLAGQTPRRWTAEEKDLLIGIGDQLAVATENARLYEETLRQAQQLQQILDTTPQGILLLDEKHRIEMANPIGTQYLPLLTDREPGELLTHLGNRPLEQILASQPGEIPYEVTGLAPTKRQFEVGANPLTADGPGPTGWVLVLRDVTGERAVQERIQQHERLAAVGQLAAGIAHDFNNLLQGIIGFADLLQHKPNLDDSTRHGLEVITTQGQRAAQLVRQILDFSRRSVTNQQPMDLLELATETVRLLRRTLPGNIRITLDHDPAGGFIVRGDVGQLQQVLTNLAVNARDAMPDGGTLHLHLAGVELHTGDPTPFPEMKLGKWVTLAVSDSGTGIPTDALPHLFEPFFTTKEVGKGSGLGLAQVYGIVRQHEGYIDVTSEVNRGTTFTIYLPAWHEAPADSDLPDWENIPRGHGEVILIVDDDPSVRQVCQAMVESLGYETLSAGNGREAIAIYAEHHDDIALVLSDIVMPAMGGAELARELQQIDPKAKVVLITGYPLGQAQRGLKAEGVMDWIQKPLSLSELGEKVRKAIGGERGA